MRNVKKGTKISSTSPSKPRTSAPSPDTSHTSTPSAQCPQWLLRSLGQADVIVNGQRVSWPARSAEELLWFLHAHPDGCYRHDILDKLWNLNENPATTNRFRVALHRLRQTLGCSDAVREDHGRYVLHPDIQAASDTHALHQALLASKYALSPYEKEERLRQALASAEEGEYLPHLKGEWVERVRAEHKAAVVEAQIALALLHCAACECALATAALTKAAQIDPLINEEHHQRLMGCLTVTHSKYAAIEHYRRYRHFLQREVGDTPMPETVQFAERLKMGERYCQQHSSDQSHNRSNNHANNHTHVTAINATTNATTNAATSTATHKTDSTDSEQTEQTRELACFAVLATKTHI